MLAPDLKAATEVDIAAVFLAMTVACLIKGLHSASGFRFGVTRAFGGLCPAPEPNGLGLIPLLRPLCLSVLAVSAEADSDEGCVEYPSLSPVTPLVDVPGPAWFAYEVGGCSYRSHRRLRRDVP